MGSNLKKQASSTLANGNGNGNGNEQWAFLGTTAKRTIHLSGLLRRWVRRNAPSTTSSRQSVWTMSEFLYPLSRMQKECNYLANFETVRSGSVRSGPVRGPTFSRIKIVKRSIFQNPVYGSTYPNSLVGKSMARRRLGSMTPSRELDELWLIRPILYQILTYFRSFVQT